MAAKKNADTPKPTRTLSGQGIVAEGRKDPKVVKAQAKKNKASANKANARGRGQR